MTLAINLRSEQLPNLFLAVYHELICCSGSGGDARPDLGRSGPLVLSCAPDPPTHPSLPRSFCHGAQGSDVNLGRLYLLVDLTLDVSSVLTFGLSAEPAQTLVARSCSCCSFTFIPCRRPPAAIKSHPQISVSIIFSSPSSFIPYEVRV